MSLGNRELGRKDWLAFWKLLIIQAQNAFNEKGAQFVLIPLGVWLYGQEGDLEYPLGAIIVLPFILISPLAGWVSDHFCKTRIVQWMALLQLIVLGGMFLCLRQHSLTGALIWFCVFAVQATIFSPSKKGLVKDIVGSRHIGLASGLLEMASILSLLAGQIGVLLWFSYLLEPSDSAAWYTALFKPEGINDGWYAASVPCFAFFLLALPIVVMSWTMPRYPRHKTAAFRWKLLWAHIDQLSYLWRNKHLRTCELGIGYFWFFGGTVMLMTIQMAKATTGGGDNFGLESALLMAWLSGGTVVGGVLAALMCRGGVRLSLALVGGLGMCLSCLGLVFAAHGNSLFFSCLFAAGLAAAFFLVPLNAHFQDSAENSERGNVIAAGNLIDCFLGLVAVGFQYIMMLLMPVSMQFLVMAALSLILTFFVRRELLK